MFEDGSPATRPHLFEADIIAVKSIPAIPSILDVICRTTGMGFAAVARVTEDRWITCAAKDDIDFGLQPGGELKVETTICREIRQSGTAVIIDDVAKDASYCGHATPALYGFQSYISMPIVLPDGQFFGTLCAIDPKPAKLNRPEVVGMFKMFADLIAFHLDAQRRIHASTVARERAWQLSQDLLSIVLADGTFQAANQAWLILLGWEPDQLVGRHFASLVHPDDLSEAQATFARLAEQPIVDPFECRFRHRDGSWRWFAWTASFEGGRAYGSGRDITLARKQAETLRQSQTRAAIYFDLSNDYLFLTRIDADGVVWFEDLNPAFEHVIGIARADAVGRRIENVVPSNSVADISRYAQLCLETRQLQKYVAEREYQDGQKSIIEGRVAFVEQSIHGGGLVLFSGHDVTEQRSIEEALRQAQKMEAVGQLTGGLAHDFNNLLAGISGSLELMQIRMQQGRFNDVERYMTVAQGASKRAAALTHRLLAFSRRQTLDPKPTDVNRLILGMQDMIQRTVGPSIKIEVVGASGLWPALVDPSQLENALLNLCINARDAMPDGGRITIETANKWIDESGAKMHDLPCGQYLSLCVTDTGTGMGPEVIARVFEPFFTTKPTGEGTGLGLSMIYGFAQQSGGQVRIYSEVGTGSTVCIYLPRHYGEAESTDAVFEAQTLPRSGDGETVLVVDDEPSVRMLVTDILEDLGYIAIEASDSAAGLRVLQSNVRIDLLVTDVGLPGGMNGRQMADAARISRPDLNILFITGYAENAILNHGHLAPGMAVMTKPFPIEKMAARIRSMIEAKRH
jgi:PAS domain S-box-containing protein